MLAVAAELKTRLNAAEAANENPVAAKEHHAASGTRVVPAIWFLQPKVRDRKLVSATDRALIHSKLAFIHSF